jgi:hypothetical protein
MEISRGAHIRGLRIRVSFYSEDVETHSHVTKHQSSYERVIDDISDFARSRFADLFDALTRGDVVEQTRKEKP